MITQIDKSLLFSTFGVANFDTLEISINSMAPSMVEYYLSDLSAFNEDNYLNKRNIQQSLNFGDYNLHLDYSDDIYLETTLEEEDLTQALW